MDGTTSIILNAVGTANDVSENLKAFLDYVVGKMSEDSYVRRLDMAVELAKLDPDLKRDYLVRMQNSIQFEKEVRAKVQAEVQAEVRAEGQNELAKAIHMLKDGSSEENLLSAGIAQDTIDLARTCL